jgi:hypothetical protein
MLDVLTYALVRGYTNAAINQAGSGTKEIEVEIISGSIPKEKLDELLKSTSNVIKCDDKYYRLARIEGNNLKYISSYTNGSGQIINMVELDIDKTTGDFSTKQIIFEGSSVAYLEEQLQDHINDNTVHITATERNY